MKHFATLVAATVLVAGCSTPSEPRMPERYSGRSAAFRDGYNSGCSYGRAAASGQRDDGSRDQKRIEAEPDYANGWFDAFEWCRDNYRPSSTDRRSDPTKPVRTEGGW